MIEMKKVSFKYENSGDGGAVKDINVTVPDGQVVLVCGESGSGKTTFGRLINGLIPSYYEGEVKGEVLVNGHNVFECELHEIAPVVGSVFQNPKSQFYTLLVDTEVVFACENLGLDREEILKRFDEAGKLYGLENIVGKSLFELSGGEKQKVACASVGALDPDVYVLDEPTSNLDIGTIRELKNIIYDLKKRGKTIIIIEHRLSWLRDVVDRVLYFENGIIKLDEAAEKFFGKSAKELHGYGLRTDYDFNPEMKEIKDNGKLVLDYCKYKIKKHEILDIKDLTIPKGSVVAVLGNNGMGKSTFARAMCGLIKKSKNLIMDNDEKLKDKVRQKKCYMVMQDVNHQLFSESVIDDIMIGQDENDEAKKKRAEEIIKWLDLEGLEELHPMSLSGGQRQRVAIAGAVMSEKDYIIFDEPTSGLDYRHMLEVSKVIDELSEMGKTQFVITHDPELVEACCNYYVFIENGKVVRQGDWKEDDVKFIQNYFGE
ncbi:MAG: ABC transporter ATP-binding protein [Lachnospiraceae bacterium]|nr:ABC transporter ATP-binding protein [Lachnospiraceae bacterium]